MPENIVLVGWPASRPAWHPVERLWADLQRRIDVGAARVRSSLAAWQEHVAPRIQRSPAETIAALTG
jgi:hypothetical protein